MLSTSKPTLLSEIDSSDLATDPMLDDEPLLPLMELMDGLKAQVHVDTAWITTELAQSFTNNQSQAIEANYTFPMPSGGILLSIKARIGEREFVGEVQAKQAAQTHYDQAIEQGDSAILLEDLGNGLMHLSLGNLLPNETLIMHYRYVQPTRTSSQQIRLHCPTTIAPKYGNPQLSRMTPLAYPTHANTAAYPFQLTVTLANSLSQASIASPSHPIRYQGLEEGMSLSLVGEQGMDRDFVLLIDLPQTISPQAWLAPDQTGTSLLVNYLLSPPDSQYRTPLNLKLLVDCSGSMQGESIAKSKQALLQIINQLSAEDQFSISRFGFHSEEFYPDLLPASRQYKHLAKAYIEKMDADMGGTEMEAALATCLSITDKQQKSVPADILLITDGQVNAEERMLKLMSNQQQRLFIVGISDAVSANFLSRLADTGKGYADFIYPQEEVEPVIQRMFERLRGDYVVDHQVNWSNNDIAWQADIPSRLFANESLIFGAKFNQPLTNISADLSFTWRSGAQTSVHIPSQAAAEGIATDIPRILASLYLSRNQADNASQLAQDYQLLTQDTALFMQLAREENEKGDTDPMLVSIPNALPNSHKKNGLLGRVFMRYDTSVGSIQNPVFFSQSVADIDHSGFALSVNETNPTSIQVIETSVPEVMLNNQPLSSYLPIQTIEDAHNFINALEATLSELKRELTMSKMERAQHIDRVKKLRFELRLVTENGFHLHWEDELLDDIYADLLLRLEARIETCLEALLELIENQVQAYERRTKGRER
ncbi:MAG TPA: VIT domain-containing protein [Thiotrichales bacterium]|nr:MAG: hypothetical protein B7X85_00025 [Thiotrichales bacterium 17-46-47]HQT01963.1 VIT domain-containing protein [Thiotrichales bacterium]HQT04095.1 VIT domain-containing protein [Thiotrichales bacterium]